MFHSSLVLAVLSLLPAFVSAVCRSSGWDYVDGGTYCIDTRKDEFFEFGSSFQGCTADDTQGGVDPIVVNPNNDDFICSKIQTNPDDINMLSTCNVTGEELRKKDLMSGQWTVVIEGLTFAWMRQFSIIAGTPVEVTSTPIATLTLTSTPITTSTLVSTSTIQETVPASTVTVPATTQTTSRTIIPSRVTTTTTYIKTITIPAFPPEITKVTTMKTITTRCRTAPPRWDPINTVHAAKASLAAAIKPSGRFRRGNRLPARSADLAARTPDQCTTTVFAEATTVTTTSLAPFSTITETSIASITATV